MESVCVIFHDASKTNQTDTKEQKNKTKQQPQRDCTQHATAQSSLNTSYEQWQFCWGKGVVGGDDISEGCSSLGHAESLLPWSPLISCSQAGSFFKLVRSLDGCAKWQPQRHLCVCERGRRGWKAKSMTNKNNWTDTEQGSRCKHQGGRDRQVVRRSL